MRAQILREMDSIPVMMKTIDETKIISAWLSSAYPGGNTGVVVFPVAMIAFVLSTPADDSE
jgi:hypothetical protein